MGEAVFEGFHRAIITGDGLAHVDYLRWYAFHEGQDLTAQVETYRDRYGYYPKRVIADPIYGTRANRNYLKEALPPLCRQTAWTSKQVTDSNREQLKQDKAQPRQDYWQRIPNEGKNGYCLNAIRARRANTAFA